MFAVIVLWASAVQGFQAKAAEGVDVATSAIKSRINRLLQDEATRSLSDREIVAMLAREGVKIARRTVAKYRTQLGIMSSSKRKKKL